MKVLIEDGFRVWRNPDFVVVGQEKKVVLLDAYLNKPEHEQEMQDYLKVGFSVLRVSVPELQDTEWLIRKIEKFLSG
jgi:hypothetical protein